MGTVVLFNEGMHSLGYETIAESANAPGLTLRFTTYASTLVSSLGLSDFPMATDSGLADFIFDPSLWTSATTGGVDTETYPPKTFTAAGGSGQTIHAIIVFDGNTGLAWWGVQLDAPWVAPSAGQTILVNNSFQVGAV